MNLENIVCSLELATKLKDLGIKQSSLFHWVEVEKEKKIYRTVWEARELDNVIACAFTVEEIFDFLPFEFFKDETRKLIGVKDNVSQEIEHIIPHRYTFTLNKIPCSHDYWYCWATGHGYDNFGLTISETSFNQGDNIAANACAKMLIYLIENKLINT